MRKSNNVVEEQAHCYIVQCRRIVCGQCIAEPCTKPMVLGTSNVLYAADEGLRAEMSCIQLLINLLHIAHKLFAYKLC